MIAAQLIGVGLSGSPGLAVLFALGSVVNDAPLPIPHCGLGSLSGSGLVASAVLIIGLVFQHPDYGALSALRLAASAVWYARADGRLLSGLVEALRQLSPVAASSGCC